ncbi:cytochrome b5-like heme/steroid binding domain-containing protein [Exophiala viscosa]|uniref:Cytochrome b5-like heme/steroid binding domain-containing protein n=1 Tax=Exophiala viscosa TaxID=2486360 RepID=A0AAN6E2D1_9EURO|nr:cytochrome b5-like heme/steroid binding domain-containing protein [Exophiala viscosa]KAI1630423.1 cytochrome b5-like heme/steroid binding domain-containing protein [Exophiala viscosa]
MADPTSPSAYSENKRFEPKVKVELAEPSDKEITLEELSQCDGSNPDKPTYVAIKGTVFDVSKNTAYGEKGSYRVFAGKDPSRALALSSLKPEDCVAEWDDLDDKYKTVLDEWYSFFSKRYNIVGKVAGAHNTGRQEGQRYTSNAS